jgi:hypothetical protein
MSRTAYQSEASAIVVVDCEDRKEKGYGFEDWREEVKKNSKGTLSSSFVLPDNDKYYAGKMSCGRIHLIGSSNCEYPVRNIGHVRGTLPHTTALKSLSKSSAIPFKLANTLADNQIHSGGWCLTPRFGWRQKTSGLISLDRV